MNATLAMATRVDAYLTGKAAAVWPAALIVCVDDEHGNTRFLLQRPGLEDLGLGSEFNDAKRALYAAIEHHKAGGKLPG